jgi:hypothetical protein
MMSFKCKECGQDFDTTRSLHTHIKKHYMFLGDYYVKHFQRKNKLTGELLPFKNYKDYFAKDFSQPHQLMEWCKCTGDQEVKEYIAQLLKKRTEEKGLSMCPTEIELLSSGLPGIAVYKKHFGSYTEACSFCSVKPLLDKNIPKEFNNDYSKTKILIDTREQQPLSFENSEPFKLDVGDYGVTASDYDYTFVDRKSFGDFCGTVTVGYSRFCKELDRCRSLGNYMFIVVETAFEDMEEENMNSYKRFKLNYVYHNMRELQRNYKDCCQFVFAGSRDLSIELIPKLLILGKKLWSVDMQYFWSDYVSKK